MTETIIAWVAGAALWLVVVGALVWWSWGWRRAIGAALAVILLFALVGLGLALIWRAAEWWLSVIPSFV